MTNNMHTINNKRIFNPFRRRLESTIAWRYLFGKKSHNAINIISGIAVVGITVATVAMVVVLSVFNGFHDLIEELYTEFDPVLKVVPAEGKYFSAEQTDSLVAHFEKHPRVAAVSRVIEDEALILFRGHPEVVTVKGVDDNFDKVTNIRSILFGEGEYQLHRADMEYAIPGIGLSQMMGGATFPTLQICAPRGGERINVMDPLESLSVVDVDNTGLVFSMNQRKYDDRYILISYALSQQLFEKEGQCTQLELALKSTDAQPFLGGNTPQGTSPSWWQSLKAQFAKVSLPLERGAVARSAGGGSVASSSSSYRLLNRMEQQASTFSIMQIEKLLAYVFLTFILLVACFNIISSVSMLIIEKQGDMRTLSHLGMPLSGVRKIFMTEGQLITLIGTLSGIAIGVSLCLAQQYYGLIRLGTGENFIVQSYPVSVHPLDIIAILFTALIVGYVATWYPVRHFTKDK